MVRYAYPSQSKNIDEITLSIVKGISSREPEERRKAHLHFLEVEKQKFIAKTSTDLHSSINMVFDHFLAVCDDVKAFEDDRLGKAYQELSSPKDEGVKLTVLQEAFKKIEHIFKSY